MEEQVQEIVYVVGYTRYSSLNQSENSTEYQLKRIASYCAMKGYKLVTCYNDMATTGTNGKRDEFQKMLEDAKNHPKWTKVLVFTFSRFFRNTEEAIYYKKLLNQYGIELVSVTQEYGNSPEGKLMETITFAIDTYQSAINAVHTHAGMYNKAMDAKHCGGIPPLGYDVDKNKDLIINPVEAEIVKEIFNLYEANISYTKMAEQLNSKGYTTKKGTPFNKHSFSGILQQKKYIGTYTWNRTEQKTALGKRNSRKEKDEKLQINLENRCPVIISKEQFERVQKLMKSRARGSSGSKARYHYMLSGLKILKCAECGSYLIGETTQNNGKKYQRYYCPNHKAKTCNTKPVKADCIETLVAGNIIRDLYNRTDVKAINKEMVKTDSSALLRHRLKDTEKGIINIRKAIENGGDESLVTRYNTLVKEKASLERQIAVAEKDSNILDKDSLRDACKKLSAYLKKSDDSQVKEYICSIVKEVLVDNDEVIMTMVDF